VPGRVAGDQVHGFAAVYLGLWLDGAIAASEPIEMLLVMLASCRC